MTETSDDENNYYKNEVTETHHNHLAIQGCVIVNQDDSVSMVQYSEKCESCGYVSSSKRTIYHDTGTYTSSFMCPECHNTQSVEVETSQY